MLSLIVGLSDKDRGAERFLRNFSLYLNDHVLYSLSLLFFHFFLQIEAYVLVSGDWRDHPGTVAILVPSLVGDYRAEVRAAHLDNRVLFGTVQG